MAGIEGMTGAVGLVIHLVTALITGAAAGGVVYAGIVYRQKSATAAIYRIERFVTWVVGVVLEIAEKHNKIHPEAKINVHGLERLLFNNAGRDYPSEGRMG